MINLNDILNKIPQSNNICLFPLRLETRFFGSGASKELRVRIIPDEILLDYHKNGLNPEEAEDGKRFWIQWYIASGSERREYEAWLTLCAKYPVSRAAWICRCLRPPKFDRYKKVPKEKIVEENKGKNQVGYGDLFGHRPFPGITEIENACEQIYKNLGQLPIDETCFINQSDPDDFEKKVTDLCQKMLNDVYEICKNLRQTAIVDYLYDSVLEMAMHLKRRLESISKIYDEHPDLKKNVTFDQTKDLDYWSLNDLMNVVNDFIRNYKKDYRQSLPEMIEEYLRRMDVTGSNRFFNTYTSREKKNLEIPEASFLPDKFVLIGEAVDVNGNVIKCTPSEKDYIVYSNDVKRSEIKLSIDPNSNSSCSIDSNGLKVDKSIQWLFDYNAAVSAGMAITVKVGANVKGFNYIYVLGVKQPNANQDDLLNLFNGHNYFGQSLELLDPRVATNIVDGDAPASQEELEKRSRYEIEINGRYVLPVKSLEDKRNDVDRNDAERLSNRLNVDYNNCIGHIYNFDSEREVQTRKAYEILWKKVYPNYNPNSSLAKDFIGKFFIEHVRATGNIPSVKIGNLPYGFLPVSVYENMCTSLPNTTPEYQNLRKLLSDLNVLRNRWETLSAQKVNNPSVLKGVNAEKKYLEMAGQMPYSVSYIQRDEFRSSLIEKNVPSLSGLSILKELFDVAGCENQSIQNTDKIYKIENSKLVTVLRNAGYDKEKALNYVTEFIDLLTYRLDSWYNGILDYIMSKKSGDKCQIGTYGWIFNLREKDSKNLTGDQDHYVVAPSIQHALSAAVLRSAYLKSRSSKTDSHVCVNLSSMRARQALRLVDGVRSGMSMSVVLGCDLERYLHDAALHGEKNNPVDLDKFIYPLRLLFPQTINVEAKDSRAEDHAMQVINGEALLETIINHDDWSWNLSVHKWLDKHAGDDKMAWLQDSDLQMTDNERSAFFNIIERLMDSYDALNDLLLSESVHRLVMGDQASFYAIGNFMANGEGGLPDPEILKTPSEHAVISHKAGVMLPLNVTASSKSLGLIEPGVDAWIESLVGGMDKICFFVKRTENEQTIIEPYSLKYVNVSASDYLYLSAYPATFINYLETRWRLKTGNYTSEITIIESGDDATISCSSNQLSLEDDSFRIQTIRNLLKKSHGMLPSDWITDIQSDKANEDLIDKNDLSKRCVALLDKAKNLLSTMIHWLYQTSIVDNVSGKLVFNGEFDDKKVSEAYGYLCDCIELGLTNCFTGFSSEAFAGQYDIVLQFQEHEHSIQVQEDLFRMVQSAKDELERRIDEFTESVGSCEENFKKCSSESIIVAIQNLTLKNVKIFPKFHLENNGLDIDTFVTKKNFECFNDKLNQDSFDQWQDEIAEVREGMKDLHNLSMAQAALNKDEFSVSILQTSTKLDGNTFSGSPKLALIGGDWLGLPVDDESKLRDVDSFVLYNIDKTSFKSSNYNSGFVFDAWLEYIPYKKHNAGLVFHCDRPDAEAPQTILLAVNPNKANAATSKWDFDSLRKIIEMTSKMMKCRALDPYYIYEDSELSKIFPLFGNKFGN